MNKILKGLLAVALVAAPAALSADVSGENCCEVPCCTNPETLCDVCDCCPQTCCNNKVYGQANWITLRSQSRDLARWLVGTHDRLASFDAEGVSGTFSLIFEYNQSFGNNSNSDRSLATWLLPECCNCVEFGFDCLDDTVVRNEDFGYSGSASVCFAPKIQGFVMDLHLDLDLNECLCGMFAYVDLPIAWQKIDPQICPTEQDAGDGIFDTCVMATDEVDALTITEALAGTPGFGDAPAMCFGVLNPCKNSKWGVADIRAALGYNFLLTDCSHFGVKFVVAAPTGTTRKGLSAFEPIVGNGGLWEVGGGIVGHALLWERDDHALSFHIDAEVTTMLKSRQQVRLFDLTANGNWSRYLLLKKFNSDGEYVGLERGSNALAMNTKVSANVQGEIAALLSYEFCSWVFDLGYDFWGVSGEKLKEACCCLNENNYGIKGVENVCNPSAPSSLENTTDSGATIACATGADPDSPVYLTCADINLCSGLNPSGTSSAVFGMFGYNWEDCDWQPFLGVGFKAEWSNKGNTAESQWKIWFKTAISF